MNFLGIGAKEWRPPCVEVWYMMFRTYEGIHTQDFGIC